MEKKTTIYSALAVLLAMTSCSQESPTVDSLSSEGQKISFRTNFPMISQTRAGIVSNENLSECRVTCFNPEDANLVLPDSKLKAYFSHRMFEKHADGHFLANDPSTIWPNSRHRLHFFAYYPEIDTLKVHNNSRLNEGAAVFDYQLKGFQVAQDIADQIDFIAAYSSATQPEGGVGTIELNFTHQLARLDISAWGASEKYDFEIAGIRIGNATTQGDFNFSALSSSSASEGVWLNTAGSNAPVKHIFSEGESIVLLSKERQSHASIGDAASIMGNAGPAMVIPMAEKIDAWEGKGDPNIDAESYSTDKLYLSVLLRVINRNNEVVYPYPNNCDFIPVTYLAVGADGKVIRRVYLIDGEYYTENLKSEAAKYTPASSDEVRGFCWAALPITGGAKWEAGKIYNYKLNYTNGIGWQDPEDPTPGEPIIERGLVPFEVSVAEWVEAEGHDPNLEVPKR